MYARVGIWFSFPHHCIPKQTIVLVEWMWYKLEGEKRILKIHKSRPISSGNPCRTLSLLKVGDRATQSLQSLEVLYRFIFVKKLSLWTLPQYSSYVFVYFHRLQDNRAYWKNIFLNLVSLHIRPYHIEVLRLLLLIFFS